MRNTVGENRPLEVSRYCTGMVGLQYLSTIVQQITEKESNFMLLFVI